MKKGELSRKRLREKTLQKGVKAIALSPEEFAGAIGVSLSTVYRLIRTKRIPSARLGKRILIPLSAVDEFLNGEREEEEVAHARR